MDPVRCPECNSADVICADDEQGVEYLACDRCGYFGWISGPPANWDGWEALYVKLSEAA